MDDIQRAMARDARAMGVPDRSYEDVAMEEYRWQIARLHHLLRRAVGYVPPGNLRDEIEEILLQE